jgi:hypothetical protein
MPCLLSGALGGQKSQHDATNQSRIQADRVSTMPWRLISHQAADRYDSENLPPPSGLRNEGGDVSCAHRKEDGVTVSGLTVAEQACSVDWIGGEVDARPCHGQGAVDAGFVGSRFGARGGEAGLMI